MNTIKRITALLLVILLIASVGVISAFAAQNDTAETSATGITIHFKSESKVPYVYYWNALPNDLSTSYPGVKMTKETAMANGNWYTYKFPTASKINLLFTDGSTTLPGQISSEITVTETGEWWYKNNKLTSYNPDTVVVPDRTDLREESIYFVITTRFYDGDTGNNVHCWDDKQANNPDSDPAWRGDFKGLIDKLDYLKALGFSAIWITPVVENASGYDYHGYHSFDITKVDPRYESKGATYEDLLKAAHDKDMKIIQDVVWNHTGNFGDSFLAPMFTKEYNKIQDLGTADCMKVIPGGLLDKKYSNYDSLQPDAQFQARLDVMKGHKSGAAVNLNEYYHRETGMGYEGSIEQQGSMAGDCVDVNTENPAVAKYITDTYREYADMGVDAFRLDTEKHINRWTLNNAYFPKFYDIMSMKTDGKENFHIFGEVCSRVRETWNHNIPSSSPAFFTWEETNSA
ncbi:MAG: starch-binding protein, partial [Ruminococcus sp.]|nr:starch-binding protein [Ruminococcus sp.]